jgi:hypothetical protein
VKSAPTLMLTAVMITNTFRRHIGLAIAFDVDDADEDEDETHASIKTETQ